MTSKEIDRIIEDNEDFIFHWIEEGKTKAWISKYLGMSVNGFTNGLKRAGFDFNDLKNKNNNGYYYDIPSSIYANHQEEEKDDDKEIIDCSIVDDNFEFLLDCYINNIPVHRAAEALNVNERNLIKALYKRCLIMEGMPQERKRSTDLENSKHRSKGEEAVRKLLIEMKKDFKEQYVFDDCRFKDTNSPARFDFAVFDYYGDIDYIIEYDGEQHTHKVDCYGGEEGFKKTQEHDRIKEEYLKRNNIPLIRIPYTIPLDNISYYDLELSYSMFRVF